MFGYIFATRAAVFFVHFIVNETRLSVPTAN